MDEPESLWSIWVGELQAKLKAAKAELHFTYANLHIVAASNHVKYHFDNCPEGFCPSRREFLRSLYP